MSSLSTRLAKLEQARAQATLANTPSVFFVVIKKGDDTKPFQVEYEGCTWIQEPEESMEQFKARVIPAAMVLFKPEGRIKALGLCARRPSLSLEAWRTKYGVPDPADV
ncbi:MAG: hypothetical protein QM749_19765 [Aquabacterium sp.]